MNHSDFMKIALSLAERRKGLTHPNPTVGCVIVKDGKVVGRGYHERAGKPHAEVVALQEAGEKARGSTVYVTLEPCSHYGKTPPCSDALIKAGVKEVFVALQDPNPLVSGKGINRLKEAGIKVYVGLCEEEARRLNEDFFLYIREKRPYITLKMAQSIDGRFATLTGDSKWITSEESRRLAHKLRAEASAILVGVGTVISDDPQLTVRHVKTDKQPLKVILDPNLDTPLSSKVFKEGRTIIFTSRREVEEIKKLNDVEVINLELVNGAFDLQEVVRKLYEREVMHLMVEGGGYTITSFLRAGLFDRVCVFQAPKFIGKGKGVGDLGVRRVSESITLKLREFKQLSSDVYLEYVRI